MRPQDVKYGPVYHFKQASFYAASGSIVYHDDREKAQGSCNIMSIDTVEFRARALEEGLNHITGFTPGEIEHRRNLKRLVHDLDCVIKDAKEQGDPMSPEVQKWYKTHKPWKNSVSFATPAGVVTKGTADISYEIPMPESKVSHHVIGNRLIY